MANRYSLILLFVSLLLLTTLSVSCRQHRIPKSITFTRTVKSNDNVSEEDKSVKRKMNQKYLSTTDSMHRKYIPAPLLNGSEQIICRRSCIISYSKDTKIPNWVAWHLTSEHTDGDCPRDNAYYEDTDVPLPRATNEDYRGSGWSRGHMCPAGDNKWDAEAMRESNKLTNICPQHASLNTGLWNVIEHDCRKWAKKYGSVYIVCGPILLNKEHETIGRNKVVVPEAFFKVILRMNPQPAAIGFVVRNNDGKKKKDQFINTVDDIERITGIDFFPALPDSIEEKVEAYANINDW